MNASGALVAAVQRRFRASTWWTTASLALLAAVLRFRALGQPHAFSFDETYYAKDAFSLLRFGYERKFVEDANLRLLAGNLDVFTTEPAYVVHPPLGKWVIAVGEALFGVTPFGWRFMMALLGVGIVVMVHRIALRLTGSAAVALLAGFFTAIDGIAIVMSRTALLDQTLTFFVVATFGALLLDRDANRRRLLYCPINGRDGAIKEPSAAWRPWRVVAIVTITAAMATKWSALWFALVFAGLAFWWDARARIAADERWSLRSALTDVGWLVTAIVIGAGGYVASWAGWLLSTDAFNRQWAQGRDLPRGIPGGLAALFDYHRQALGFHVGLTSDHPYKALSLWWPVQWRPTSFFYEEYEPYANGCLSDTKCAAEVLALGNPIIWWLATGVVIGFLLRALLRRVDTPSVEVMVPLLAGLAAGWLPWIYYYERTTFNFYSIAFAPFMYMTLAYWLVRYRTAADGVGIDVGRRRLVRVLVIAIVLASVFMYPVWAGDVIDKEAWTNRMWLPSWI